MGCPLCFDAEWTVGEGATVEGSMGAILLLTGRTVSLSELSDDGAGKLIATR